MNQLWLAAYQIIEHLNPDSPEEEVRRHFQAFGLGSEPIGEMRRALKGAWEDAFEDYTHEAGRPEGSDTPYNQTEAYRQEQEQYAELARAFGFGRAP